MRSTFRNSLVAVTTTGVKSLPPASMGGFGTVQCSPVFKGMEFCSVLAYTYASSQEASPYFPLTGVSR